MIYEINWFMDGTSPHQKCRCEQNFKNNDALIHSPTEITITLINLLSHSRDRF